MVADQYFRTGHWGVDLDGAGGHLQIATEKSDTEIESLSTSVPFPPLSPDKLPAWIAAHAHDKGLALADGCAELIDRKSVV